jgi:hypothetical protein
VISGRAGTQKQVVEGHPRSQGCIFESKPDHNSAVSNDRRTES